MRKEIQAPLNAKNGSTPATTGARLLAASSKRTACPAAPVRYHIHVGKPGKANHKAFVRTRSIYSCYRAFLFWTSESRQREFTKVVKGLGKKDGALDGIRTHDLSLRRAALYPAELQALKLTWCRGWDLNPHAHKDTAP